MPQKRLTARASGSVCVYMCVCANGSLWVCVCVCLHERSILVIDHLPVQLLRNRLHQAA